MLKRRVLFMRRGFKEYEGSAQEICQKIVDDCWSGTYYKTSTGHFSAFYTRDFGMCVPALLFLKQHERVHKTLTWVLQQFKKHEKITTSITAAGEVFDFPTIAPDSLAFLVFALVKSKAKNLITLYQEFLNQEIQRYYTTCVESTGLPKLEQFSSIKDHAIRERSCYDTTMFGWLAKLLKEAHLANPFAQHNYPEILLKNYWVKDHFIDDLSGIDTISSDANMFPFWCEIIQDKQKLTKALQALQQEYLDTPFPAQYTSTPPPHRWIKTAKLAPNYEGTTIWPHLGMIYLDLLKNVDKKRFHVLLHTYKEAVEKHKTFLELFNKNGTPYKTTFYVSDEGMLWASMYLFLEFAPLSRSHEK